MKKNNHGPQILKKKLNLNQKNNYKLTKRNNSHSTPLSSSPPLTHHHYQKINKFTSRPTNSENKH